MFYNLKKMRSDMYLRFLTMQPRRRDTSRETVLARLDTVAGSK